MTHSTVACYVRVSTFGQNEAGQKHEIERWLQAHNLTARWFVDKASGDNLDRPAFQELQKAIFAGEIKTVVIWKLDRLSRSLRDGINVLSDWLDADLRVVSVTQGHDFSGAVGKMVASILLSVAELEQETRRERQQAGISAAKERGVYRGRSPGSYKVDPGRVRSLKARGMSNREIAKVVGVSAKTVARYLTSDR